MIPCFSQTAKQDWHLSWADFSGTLMTKLFYSPALLHAVYDLQAKYPRSANLEFYKPQIEKLKASLEAGKKTFDAGRIIEANYSSFNNLLKRFEGKNLLVDVWATWCHPCIEDFKYKDKIQHFIDSGRIEILYISIDKPEWDDRWRQSIKINQLAGHHYRASTKFILDMWEVIQSSLCLLLCKFHVL
jgi:thiol-disulfide isomerase/thioredoxin